MISPGTHETLLSEFFSSAAEVILLERKAKMQNITSSPHKYRDYIDYMKQSLGFHRKDLSRPLVIDLYMYHPGKSTHILVEKWILSYQPNNDPRDSRSFAFLSRRVLTLVRSIHCFVRLLPGFNMLAVSEQQPIISFQLHTQKDAPAAFVKEPSRYSFPSVSTSRGLLSVSVMFVHSAVIEEVIKSVNSNIVGASGSSQKVVSSTASTSSSSTGSTASPSIPIPNRSRRDSGSQKSGNAFITPLCTSLNLSYNACLSAVDGRSRSIDQQSGQLFLNARRPSLSERMTPIRTISDHFGSPPQMDPTLTHARSLPSEAAPIYNGVSSSPASATPIAAPASTHSTSPQQAQSLGANNSSPSQLHGLLQRTSQLPNQGPPIPAGSIAAPNQNTSSRPQSLSWTSTPPFLLQNLLVSRCMVERLFVAPLV